MSIFRAPTPGQLNIGLAVLRVIVGAIFLAHGAQKLFVFGLEGVSGAFGGMGIPMAGVLGPATALVEFFGGLALIVGLLTRPAALGLGLTMAGAIYFVHLNAGLFLPNGSEFALSLLGSAVLFVLAGGGTHSIDALIARRSTPVAADRTEAEHRVAEPRQAA